MKISWPVALVVVLVLVLVLGSSSRASPAPVIDTTYDRAVREAALHLPPAANGGGQPVAGACRTAFAANDPSRYVGHKDQRVAAVSTANNAIATVNCGAVGVIEKGVSAVGHFIGRIL